MRGYRATSFTAHRPQGRAPLPEHTLRRAAHEDSVGRDLDDERATREMNDHFVVLHGEAALHRCHDHRTRTRSTGIGPAHPPLEYAHVEATIGTCAHELDIHATRDMRFDGRPEALRFPILQCLETNRVRIPDIDPYETALPELEVASESSTAHVRTHIVTALRHPFDLTQPWPRVGHHRHRPPRSV